jgi:transitional endoplasmic reticulum ATPase
MPEIEYAGCHVVVPDDVPAGEYALDGALPKPVRAVDLSVAGTAPDAVPVHRLIARIETTGPRPGLTALGRDPVGVLLERRLAAGDAWAARVVDGLEGAAESYRRLLPGRTDRPGPLSTDDRRDEPTGFTASVTRPAANLTTVTMLVPADGAPPLDALLRLTLDVVGELAAEPPAGTFTVLSRSAAGPQAPDLPPPVTDDDTVTLDQVGGLPGIVAEFREIAVSFRHPEVMARWGARRPQGILLYGPPGTGKTMLARALATEIGADFREVRTPEILDKWLGASERNIKRIFREARRYRTPTVLLFDEFDSIISYAGAGGDAASQAVNAVAGIFKQEMNDLFADNPDIIVVATTNFPHRVDDSLIRSGRFDVKLSVPSPDEAGRAEILRTMMANLATRHDRAGFRLFADDVDPAVLAVACPGMTGADLREALRRAQLAKAMEEARTGAPVPPIGQDDLLRHLGELGRTPTVR